MRSDTPPEALGRAGPEAQHRRRRPQNRPSFDQIIDRWFPLTYVFDNLNRGMGLQDAYPLVLPTPVLDKLRFIDEVVGNASHVEERAKATAAS